MWREIHQLINILPSRQLLITMVAAFLYRFG
jgi:hypothetical protein